MHQPPSTFLPITKVFPTTALSVSLIAGSLIIAGCGALQELDKASQATTQGALPMTTRPSDGFRTHHAEILEHLGHIDAMVADLRTQSAEEQRRTMATVVGFFKEHIGPHAADEERVLYPVVLAHSGAGSRLTEVPIYEHTIVGRWIAALQAESGKSDPNAADFERTTLHLVGLLRGHFEVEEEVLLPVLDRTMTQAEFDREVASKMAH